jgi:hypothetical protein
MAAGEAGVTLACPRKRGEFFQGFASLHMLHTAFATLTASLSKDRTTSGRAKPRPGPHVTTACLFCEEGFRRLINGMLALSPYRLGQIIDGQ